MVRVRVSLSLLPPANEVWGKVIFSEACIKNSVHREGCAWSGGGAWFRGGVCVETPLGRLLLRAVRILLECLLECILVFSTFS